MRGYNASMGTQTTGYLEAIQHLPEGATLVIHEVSWDDYESLVQSLETRHLRVAYDCGRLEVVSPLSKHAAYSASRIEHVVAGFSPRSHSPNCYIQERSQRGLK